MVAGAVGQGVHLDPGAAQEGSSLLVKYGKMGDSLGEH